MAKILHCIECNEEIGEAKRGRAPLYCADCKLIRKRSQARETARINRQKDPQKSRDAGRRYRENNPEKVKQSNKNFYDAHKEEMRQRASDYRKENPEKVKLSTQRWREENADVFAEIKRIWRENNKEYLREKRKLQYEQNKEKENQQSRAYKDLHREEINSKRAQFLRENPEINRAAAGRYRSAKRRAIPAWANFEKILEIYREAVRLTKETGIPHHVDHIVPLQSKWVCGLHVETNLQILTKSENSSKSNRHWPDALKDVPH